MGLAGRVKNYKGLNELLDVLRISIYGFWVFKGTEHPFPQVPSFIWAESPCFVDYELERTQWGPKERSQGDSWSEYVLNL